MNENRAIDSYVKNLGYGEEINIKESKIIEEAVDVKKIIKDLVDTDFGGDNESQMRGVQLLKGLATNDSPEANSFMKKLNAAYTKIGKEVLDSEINEGLSMRGGNLKDALSDIDILIRKDKKNIDDAVKEIHKAYSIKGMTIKELKQEYLGSK